MIQALLSIAARPRVPAALVPELCARAARIDDWDEALLAAEWHGLGPLLYRHFRDGAVHVPTRAETQLQGLFLRHRGANAVRLRALADILDAFRRDGIEMWVLKGPALMSLVYGEPALRPTSDLDLLVPRADVFRAYDLLRDLGFQTPPLGRHAGFERHHHLPAATRSINGVFVQVELHHDALTKDDGVALLLDATREPPQTFDVLGRTAWALGRHEMLWHLCEHLVGALPIPLRLIGIADVIGYAERFSEQLDWERIECEHPLILSVLGFADGVSPLPDRVSQRIPGALLTDPRRIADLAEAWAWSPAGGVRAGGRWSQFRRTLNAPAWWLRLRYRDRHGRAGWQARLRHLSVVARGVGRRVHLGDE